MIVATREQRRQLARDNATRPAHLVEIPKSDWPSEPYDVFRVLRSRDFLVQMHTARAPALARMSVNRTTLDGHRWSDGIEWEELQRLKREAGYADAWAVEIYPADSRVVNDANMRHLWLVPDALVPFAWNNRAKDEA